MSLFIALGTPTPFRVVVSLCNHNCRGGDEPMDTLIIQPVRHSTLVSLKIADGSDGLSHSDGVVCSDIDAAFKVAKVVLWIAPLSTLPEGAPRDQVERLRDAYAKRNDVIA
jgi:hypothetical protein